MKIKFRFICLVILTMVLIFSYCHKNNPPNVPEVPIGVDNGNVDSSYIFSSSAVDPDGDDVAIRFSWGDSLISGWSTFTFCESTVSLSHSYSSSGSFCIIAQAKDDKDTSMWSEPHLVVIISALPAPSIPSGPSNGYIDSIYDFSSMATDPDSNNIAVRFVWADSDTSSWSSYIPSGQTITMSHFWSTPDTYCIKAQAKNTNGTISPWSAGHTIIIDSSIGWDIQTVDAVGNVGFHTCIALDGSSRPHISYCDNTNGDLKYAYWTGTLWNIQTVDTLGRVGQFTSIALDGSGRPHISYGNYDSYDLKYAYWTGTSWDIQTVDTAGNVGYHTSIALDGLGRPHISYCSFPSYSLKYAYWTGSSWNIQTVDAAGGFNTSIALDGSGRPHISYLDGPNYDLKYAYWTGTSWNIQTVDATGDVGQGSSIKLDGLGRPHISYGRNDSYDLKYAYWTGSSWNIQTVDAAGLVGYETYIDLDGSGQPHVSYYAAINSLKYAYWNGASWNIMAVDTIGGYYSSIALDGSGRPHISYYDATNGDLKYAYWGGKLK